MLSTLNKSQVAFVVFMIGVSKSDRLRCTEYIGRIRPNFQNNVGSISNFVSSDSIAPPSPDGPYITPPRATPVEILHNPDQRHFRLWSALNFSFPGNFFASGVRCSWLFDPNPRHSLGW